MVPPFLLSGEGGGGSGARGGRRPPGPAAADKHLSPSPYYGGHVLHILGCLEAGGGVSGGDWWGTDGEPHPVYPLSSSAPKWGLWGRRQCPQGPAGRDGLLPQPAGPLSLPTFGGGGRLEWRTPVRGLDTRRPPQIPSGPSKAVVMTSRTPDRVQLPPPASKPFQELRTLLLQATVLGAEPTDTPPTSTHSYMERRTRGPGLELYVTPKGSRGQTSTSHHLPQQILHLPDSMLLSFPFS